MGVHDRVFSYRTSVRCSCHPEFFGEGDNKAEALRNLEERITADVRDTGASSDKLANNSKVS